MNPAVSFEVFPPKTEAGLTTLRTTVQRLDQINPAYISVTYGAGGSDQQRSFDAIDAVRASTSAPIAAHLTCVGQSVADIDAVIDRYLDLGVDHIVALRGDPPSGIDAPYEPHPDGYESTADLVRAITARTNVRVSVSAYPERHPQSPTHDHDVDVLAAKIAAGADQAMTQMFFDNDAYWQLLDRVAAAGIEIPIVPGIFPIHSIDAVTRFAQRCGATMPESVTKAFAAADESEAHAVAVDLAAEQIRELAAGGVEQVHLYTLNRADLALDVCERLTTVAV